MNRAPPNRLWGVGVLGLSLAACGSLVGDSTPALSLPPATRTATELFVPQITDTAETAGTPEPSLVPTPVGAGLVQPVLFEMQFQTALQDLSPGEYLIYIAGDFSGPVGIYDFSYIGLDGSSRGSLLRVSSADLIRTATNRGTKLWMAYGLGDGVLLADLASQEVTQFATGCEDAWVSLSPVRHSTFEFGCRHLDTDREVHFIVSGDDWTARGYAFPSAPPGEVNSLLWLTPEKVAIQPRVPFAGGGEMKPSPQCVLTLADGTLHCLAQVPAWWAPESEASPDGQWVVVRYPEDPTRSGRSVAALVTLACLENPVPECVPQVIPGSDELAAGPDFVWFPDGRRLLIHDACGEGGQASPIWIYDLELNRTSKLTDGAGCFDLGPGPWTTSGEDLVLVDPGPSDNRTAWLLSVRTGAMRRLTAGIEGIFDVPGLFSVP